MTVLASDAFTRADNADLGALWDVLPLLGPFKIVSNHVEPTAAGTNAVESYNGVTWPDDQYSQAVLTTTINAGGGVGPGLVVRASPSVTTAYWLRASHAASGIILSKIVAGSASTLTFFTQTWTDGDTFRLQVQGTTLRVFLNGTQIGSDFSDASIASGRPGIGYIGVAATTSTIDAWEGGDLLGATFAATLDGAGTLAAALTTDILCAATLDGSGTLAAELTTAGGGGGGVPPTFVAAGPLATNNTIATLPVVAPTLAADDIMLACLLNKAITNAISPPDGTWTQLAQIGNDAVGTSTEDLRIAVYWKRAASGDSGATFNFTKASDDNQLFCGVISAWRGCPTTGSPIDGTAETLTQQNAADAVSFAAIDPALANGHVVYLAFYGNDQTTFAAAMSADVDPDCTLRWDYENSLGSDASIACTSGDSTGAAIAARTWASAAVVDAASTGVVLVLAAAPSSGGTVFELTVNGTLAAAGAMIRQPVKLSAGALPSAGALTRQLSLIRTVIGTLPSAGAVTARASGIRTVAGALPSAGTLTANASGIRIVAGTLPSAGVLTRQLAYIRTVTGTLPSAGALIRVPAKRVSGIQNVSGLLKPATLFKVFAGTVPLAGTLAQQRQQTRTFAGTMASVGLLVCAPTKLLIGILPMTGLVRRQPAKTLAGVVPMAGSVKAALTRLFVGVLGATGTVQMIRSQTILLNGTLGLAGTVKGLLSRALSGVLPSTGTLRKTITRTFVGVHTLTGTLTVRIARLFAGTVPTTGTIALSQGPSVSLAGTLPMTSVLRFQPSLNLVSDLSASGWLDLQPDVEFQGSMGLEGEVHLGTDVQVTGLLGLDGTLEMVGGHMVDASGMLPMAGSTSVAQLRSFSGVLALAGTLRRQPSKMLRSMLASSGVVTTRGFMKALAGTLPVSGVLTRQLSRRVVSVLTPVGTLVKQAQKRLAGVTALAGTVSLLDVSILALTGLLAPSGILAAPRMVRAFTGTLGFAGTLILVPAILIRHGTIKLINAILRFAGFTSPKLTGHGKPKDPTLGGHSTLDDSELR